MQEPARGTDFKQVEPVLADKAGNLRFDDGCLLMPLALFPAGRLNLPAMPFDLLVRAEPAQVECEQPRSL